MRFASDSNISDEGRFIIFFHGRRGSFLGFSFEITAQLASHQGQFSGSGKESINRLFIPSIERQGIQKGWNDGSFTMPGQRVIELGIGQQLGQPGLLKSHCLT